MAPVCTADADCSDGESCTTDACVTPSTCTATCDSAFPACDLAVDDGCCGPDCDSTNDLNCSSCSATEDPEVSCSDGVDNDCDGATDLDDIDCACFTETDRPIGCSCTDDGQCSRNKCKGKSGTKTCKCRRISLRRCRWSLKVRIDKLCVRLPIERSTIPRWGGHTMRCLTNVDLASSIAYRRGRYVFKWALNVLPDGYCSWRNLSNIEVV